MKPWYVYILKCSDGSLYTGCALDLEKRIFDHNSGKGAKYTRARLPVNIAYFEKAEDRSRAQKREAEIKKLSRQQKIDLISTFVLI